MAFKHMVVLLPGISGSELRKDGKIIWGATAGTVLKTVFSGGKHLEQLALPADDDATADDIGDGIVATRLIPDAHMLPGLWKIDGYSRVAERLIELLELQSGTNFFEFPYDWRRDNRVAARALERFCVPRLKAWREQSGAEDAKLIFVAHSMGGLVARHFTEVLGGWQHTRALITFGTPYRGSLNALGFLANGYAKSIGPLSLDLSAVLRSMTSVYQLLPIYKCVDAGGAGLVRVTEADIRNVDKDRATAALRFHREIEAAQSTNAGLGGYDLDVVPVVGFRQPTFQSARLQAGGPVVLLRDRLGKDESGDGTVPMVSAIPIELSDRKREMYAVEAHASLQRLDAVIDQTHAVLTNMDFDISDIALARPTPHQAAIGIDLDDAYAADAPVGLAAHFDGAGGYLTAEIVDLGCPSAPPVLVPLAQTSERLFQSEIALAQGLYRATIHGPANAKPVSDIFIVA